MKLAFKGLMDEVIDMLSLVVTCQVLSLLSQPAFTCSKSKIETVEQIVKYGQS